MKNFYFTITPGRTGTTWLAEFIKQNLSIKTYHERLETEDWGVQTPELKTMRSFNEIGLNSNVKNFWDKKFDSITEHNYAETSHVLAKAGLLEYAAEYRQQDKFKFICLNRDLVKTTISFIKRGDFIDNKSMDWLWYLRPEYNNILVNPSNIMQYGRIGNVVWYILEMKARQEYYKILYSGVFDFIDVMLEDISNDIGAETFLNKLGIDRKSILPERQNYSNDPTPSKLKEEVESFVYMIENTGFNPKLIAQDYIDSGKRLGNI